MRALVVFFLLSALPLNAAADTLQEKQAEFQRALDQTRTETRSCFPTAEELRDGNVHLVRSLPVKGTREVDGYRIAEVVVDQTGKPNHLLLEAHHEIIWNLEVAHRRYLGTVIVFGAKPAIVTGLPEGARVYSLEHNADGSRATRCRLDEKVAADLETNLRGLDNSIPRNRTITLNNLNKNLQTYADVGLRSIIRLSNPDQRGYVNVAAIRRTSEMRRSGDMILRYTDVPVSTPLDLTQPPVAVPTGLTGTTMKRWLLDNGYAEEVPEDFVEFLCMRENAEAFAVGVQHPIFGENCWPRNIWFAKQHVVLRRSLELGRYNCEERDDRLYVHIPKALEVAGSFIGCSMHAFEYYDY